MNLGRKWNFCCPAEKGLGEAMHAIIGNSSMRYFGFCERARLGEIYRQVMGIGRILIVAFAAGATEESGSVYWRNWLIIRSLSC